MPIRLVGSTLSTILMVVALLLLASVRVEAVLVRDIIELSRAGVSDRVLLAMLRSGRVKSPETATVHPVAPGVTPALPVVVVVEDRRTPQPRPYPVLIPVPVGVPLVGNRHVSRRSRVIPFGCEVGRATVPQARVLGLGRHAQARHLGRASEGPRPPRALDTFFGLIDLSGPEP